VVELTVLSNGQETSKITVSEKIFNCKYNEPLVHQVVTAYFAAGRQGTKAQKNRAACRGGGAKPWRQKGTGRARAGTSRSPLWRGGGVTFPAKPRDFSKKVNRKAYRSAFNSALSELLRQERVTVLDSLSVSVPKTKELLKKLKLLNLDQMTIVVGDFDRNLELSARNLSYVEILVESELNIVDLIAANHMVFTESALKKLGERLG